jgi:hypothetical protein
MARAAHSVPTAPTPPARLIDTDHRRRWDQPVASGGDGTELSLCGHSVGTPPLRRTVVKSGDTAPARAVDSRSDGQGHTRLGAVQPVALCATWLRGARSQARFGAGRRASRIRCRSHARSHGAVGCSAMTTGQNVTSTVPASTRTKSGTTAGTSTCTDTGEIPSC